MAEGYEKLTPAELLQTAERLFEHGDVNMYRAAILEAITALEAHVFEATFPSLQKKMAKELTDWLEEKTRMDFDTRIGILLPLAIGLKVDKKAKIWQNYKNAKEIRNKVTHSGKKVTHQQAREVINTVYEWIEYINQAQKSPLPKDDNAGKNADIFGRFIQANAQLERIIYEAVNKNASSQEIRPRAYPLDYLKRFNLVDEKEMQELSSLRSIRNKAVHSQPGEVIEITEDQIRRLNDLIESIENRLK